MQSRVAICVVALLLITVLPAVGGSPPSEPGPLYGPQDLHGSLSGWGFSPLTINQPGPTITVSQFETVILDLFSFDTNPHTWLLDLDGDGNPNPGVENESAQFSSPTIPERLTFVATSPPNPYQYVCGIHGPIMSGPFIILPGNAPPTVSLTNPDGVAQNRWTGGSVKRLTWNMNDPDGLPSQMTVWLNYSSSISSGPIAGPLMGQTFFDWTVPPIDAPDVAVSIDVADTGGATATDTNLVPIVDSTSPTVTSTIPSDGAGGIDPNADLTITFSEAISILGPGIVMFNPPSGGIIFGWAPGNTVLTVTHTPLLRATTYAVTVSNFMDASNPGNTMLPFAFSFTTANDPPVVATSQPTATSRWSGGSVHNLEWGTTDTEDPSSALTVWVNYSATGGPSFSPIAGLQGVPGDATSFAWTVPLDDTSVARVQVTANDTSGAVAVAPSPAFTIDSTDPTVTGTTPSAGQPSVPINANMVITFSEAMNQSATANAAVVGLREVPSSAWIPLAFTWAGTQLTADPVPAALLPTTSYELSINGSALDASDPGNALAAPITVAFTTGAVPDTSQPTITNVAATPPTASSGAMVDISADVTDDVQVSNVAVLVTQPDSTTVNLTMALGTGSRWNASRTWTQVGSHAFEIWASDTSGNWASASGSFMITALDTTPPTVIHTSPGSVTVEVAIAIHATVTDDGTLQAVHIVYTPIGGTEQNVTMTAAGSDYSFTIPAQSAVGIVRYRIYAVDAAGNEVFTQEYEVSVVAITPPPPPTNLAPYVGIVLLILVVILAIAYVLTRRKKQGGTEGQS